jgi:hypothetical protein
LIERFFDMTDLEILLDRVLTRVRDVRLQNLLKLIQKVTLQLFYALLNGHHIITSLQGKALFCFQPLEDR